MARGSKSPAAFSWSNFSISNSNLQRKIERIGWLEYARLQMQFFQLNRKRITDKVISKVRRSKQLEMVDGEVASANLKESNI